MEKYLQNCKTIEELKKEYRKLCFKYHPDNNGDTSIMAFINKEYDSLFNILKAEHNTKATQDTTGNTREMNETPEEFRNVINSIINLKGITIELCGSWVWVSGETKQYRKIFNANGFRWASKKEMWYWRNEKDAVRNKKSISMKSIREKYGSDVITHSGKLQIA